MWVAYESRKPEKCDNTLSATAITTKMIMMHAILPNALFFHGAVVRRQWIKTVTGRTGGKGTRVSYFSDRELTTNERDKENEKESKRKRKKEDRAF